MNKEAITIVLPLPVKVLQPNCAIGSFGGRMMKASASKRYRRLAREAVEEERVETVPWSRVSVEVTFFHSSTRRRDVDNAVSSMKSAYDGIVDSGIVPDDDYLHMERAMPIFFIDKNHPRVELTITRIDK